MTRFTKTALAATVLSFTFGLASASATPAAPKDVVAPAPGVEKTVQVCDAWGRCWWRPSPYYYGGPRYYGGYRGGYYGGRWGYRGGYYGHRGWYGHGGGWGGHGWHGGHGRWR